MFVPIVVGLSRFEEEGVRGSFLSLRLGNAAEEEEGESGAGVREVEASGWDGSMGGRGDLREKFLR